MTTIFEIREGRLVHTQPLVTDYAIAVIDCPTLARSLPSPCLEHFTTLGWLARAYVETEAHAFAMTGSLT